MSCSFPMPFLGTESEINDNLQSHNFDESLEMPSCNSCGCKRGGPTSAWPCGVRPDFVTFDRFPSRGDR